MNKPGPGALPREARRTLADLVAKKASSDPALDKRPRVSPEMTDFARLPGYRDLMLASSAAEMAGVENPYFLMHEGRAGATSSMGGAAFDNFSSYDYLGLNAHPDVAAAAKAAIDVYGVSPSASRIVAGERPVHLALEAALAAHYAQEDCVVFVSGHATNVATIGSLMGPRDLILHDALAHNSIIVGATLSRAERRPFPHNDLRALEKILETQRGSYERALIVVEGLYSMDGDVADLPVLVDIKNRHGAWLMVDEAHSFGIVGDTGRGVCEGAGLPVDSIDVYMGTLSKTLASSGGYIAGDRGLIEYMRFLCPGLIFSVGLSPSDTAAAIAALDILEREPHRPRRLRERARFFRKVARENGLTIGGDEESPVASLVVGDDKMAMQLSHNLLEYGIEVQPIVRPAVSATTARLRFFLTANHTEEQILETVPVVAQQLEKLRRGAE